MPGFPKVFYVTTFGFVGYIFSWEFGYSEWTPSNLAGMIHPGVFAIRFELCIPRNKGSWRWCTRIAKGLEVASLEFVCYIERTWPTRQAWKKIVSRWEKSSEGRKWREAPLQPESCNSVTCLPDIQCRFFGYTCTCSFSFSCLGNRK